MAELEFDFVPDAQAGSLLVRREFAGRRAQVWDCYIRAELLDRWYAPPPLVARTKHMDFRVGGYWLFAMIEPSGTEHWSRSDYQAIQPGESFTALDAFCNAEGEVNSAMPRARMTLTFTELGAHTLVETRIEYASPEDLQTVIGMGMQQGLTATLERLDCLLAELNG